MFCLTAKTLQSIRLFGPQGELNLWQTPQGFKYRLIKDDESFDCIEEVYWLWGNGTESINGFTLMEEGQQGFF